MYEQFVDEFIDNAILGLYMADMYYANISSIPGNEELVALYNERLAGLKTIDTTTEEYQAALKEAVAHVPRDNYPAYNFAIKSFNLRWSKQNGQGRK